jgi:hypothetical protein
LNRIQNPTVEIELDRKRQLCFDYNAFAELQDQGYDYTDPAFIASLQPIKDRLGFIAKPARPSLKMMRALLWAGLLLDDPTLTPQQVGSLIPLYERRAAEIFSKVLEAFTLAMGKQKGQEARESPLAQPAAE